MLDDALRGDRSARVVDLTQPLSERTPVLVLPEPFASQAELSMGVTQLADLDQTLDGMFYAFLCAEHGQAEFEQTRVGRRGVLVVDRPRRAHRHDQEVRVVHADVGGHAPRDRARRLHHQRRS